MNNPASLTREQNLHNWSQIISECQEAKANGLSIKEREKRRQSELKPLVDE